VAVKCPKCQLDNPKTSRFCADCGTPLIRGHEPNSPEFGIVSPDLPTETLQAPLRELTTGSTFAGRYQVIEELGKGGMGRVYKVLDAEVKEKVALKILKPEIAADEETIERFRNELRFARKISHKNVCRMYDLSREQGTQFITMEYVEGENLKSLMRRMGQFSIGKAVSVARQVGEGLAEAHQLGVVHRDLKPQNIMIDNDGNVRIMDFGIARSLKGKGITDARVMIGTPEYMSPEQVDGAEADGRADIYALGVVLYEMLTGKVPFEGDTALSVALKHKTEIPHDPRELNPQIPETLSALILRCLEKDKAKRYQNVEDLISDLGKIELGLTPTSGILRPASLAVPKRKKTIIAAVVGLIVLAVAVAAFLVIKSNRLDVNPKRVVVAPFENKTGDPSLDSIGSVAADWIAQGVSQAAQIEVVPGLAAQESFRIVEKESGTLQGMKKLRALARETQAGTVVSGTYYLQGDNLQFQANITDVQKGKLIYASPSVAGKKDNPMEIVKTLQQRTMGAIAAYYDIQAGSFVSCSPPTFEAYQEYLRGLELFGKDYSQSFDHMNKAVEFDPNFLLPKAIIATGYSNQGNYEKAKEIFEELNQKRTQLDQFTCLWIDSMMADLRGQNEESLRYCRLAADLAPNVVMMVYNVGLSEVWVNRPRKAIGEFSKIDLKKADLTRWGSAPWVFDVWADAHHMLGNFKKELEVAKQGERYFPERVWYLAIEARSYAAQGKVDKVREVIERSLTATSAGTTPADVMMEGAMELRAHGHKEESIEMAGEAVKWYKGRPAEEAAKEENRYYLAGALYIAERWEEARAMFEALLSEKPDNIDYKGCLGSIAARLGDRTKALQISAELKALTKPYLFGKHTYRRACIASLLGEKEQALALLREAFAQGKTYNISLHREQDLEPLCDYLPFKELVKPKG
jgi:serine/threonine protein kinase/tetratricopeptide (TPR) repeat protein